MKYMLLIYGDENALSQSEKEACYEESISLVHDLRERGQFVSTAPLHPSSRTTSVSLRNGKRAVTDGPFVETREQLGGYFLVDVDSVDEAVAIAERVPAARWGTVEVRPVIELPELAKELAT